MWEDSKEDGGREWKANSLSSFTIGALPAPDDKVDTGVVENGRGEAPFNMGGADGRNVAFSGIWFSCSHDEGCSMSDDFNRDEECDVFILTTERFVGITDLKSIISS